MAANTRINRKRGRHRMGRVHDHYPFSLDTHIWRTCRAILHTYRKKKRKSRQCPYSLNGHLEQVLYEAVEPHGSGSRIGQLTYIGPVLKLWDPLKEAQLPIDERLEN